VATPLERERYRAVMGHVARGVAVVTAADAGRIGGMTTTDLSSLSIDPILLLVSFDNDSRTLEIVRDTQRFGVNVLGADQEALARVFATKLPGAEKFEGVGHELEDGVPVLHGSLAWLACDLHDLVPGGDHTIGIGAVTAMHQGTEGEPLIWYRGGFRSLD
jgi:3-hydroxy-9,10-secoandrosta-1,3,5(10)-triene-9,17-dione monooxygenase reductase component